MPHYQSYFLILLLVFVNCKLQIPTHKIKQSNAVEHKRFVPVNGIFFNGYLDLMSDEEWFISSQGCTNCGPLKSDTNITDPRFTKTNEKFSVRYNGKLEYAKGELNGTVWTLNDPKTNTLYRIPVVSEVDSTQALMNVNNIAIGGRLGLNTNFNQTNRLSSVFLKQDYICFQSLIQLNEPENVRSTAGNTFLLPYESLENIHAIADVTPNTENYWQFQVQHVSYANFESLYAYPPFEAILSTTTPYIHVPQKFIDFISIYFYGMEKSPDGDFIIDCNYRILGKPIMFYINGGTVQIESMLYTMRDQLTPNVCALRLQVLPEEEGDRWVLGAPFIEAVTLCLGLKAKNIYFVKNNILYF